MCTIYCYKYRIHSNCVTVCHTDSETELLESVWSNFLHTVCLSPAAKATSTMPIHTAESPRTGRFGVFEGVFLPSKWFTINKSLITKQPSPVFGGHPSSIGSMHGIATCCNHPPIYIQYTPWRGSVRTFAEFYTKLIGLRGRFSAIRKTRPNQSDPTPRKERLETAHDSPSLSLSSSNFQGTAI